MLKVLSMKTLTTVLPLRVVLSRLGMTGCAKANTRKTMARMRSARSSQRRRLLVRRLSVWSSCRRATLLKYTVR